MKPFVWGHRGASAYAPENTLESFELAAKMGADGIELDVQITRDGKLVVCHDEKIDRTAFGTGFICSYTLEELKAIGFNKLHPEYQDATIPTLEEVLDLVKPTGMCVNIELKNGEIHYKGLEAMCLDCVKKMGMEERVIYSTFYHPSLLILKDLKPDIRTGLLFSDGILDVASYAKNKAHVDALHPGLANTTEELVKEAVSLGMEVNVWTVNEEKDMRDLISWGVKGLIGNYPDVARRVVDSL